MKTYLPPMVQNLIEEINLQQERANSDFDYSVIEIYYLKLNKSIKELLKKYKQQDDDYVVLLNRFLDTISNNPVDVNEFNKVSNRFIEYSKRHFKYIKMNLIIDEIQIK